MGCRPRARSALHCHGVLALRDRSLSEALLAVLEGVRLVSRQFRKRRLALWAAAGPIHGVLALRDRSLSEALLAVLEGVRLVSRQFRKRRLALWAAGRGPDPYFTAMAVLEGVRLFLGSSESDVWHYMWAAGRGPDP